MTHAKMKHKEFALTISREKLMDVKDLSPEDKLEWLGEANEFVNNFVFNHKLHKNENRH